MDLLPGKVLELLSLSDDEKIIYMPPLNPTGGEVYCFSCDDVNAKSKQSGSRY